MKRVKILKIQLKLHNFLRLVFFFVSTNINPCKSTTLFNNLFIILAVYWLNEMGGKIVSKNFSVKSLNKVNIILIVIVLAFFFFAETTNYNLMNSYNRLKSSDNRFSSAK